MGIDDTSNLGSIPGASTGDSTYSGAPSYLIGADNHNLGNGNFSLLDPSSWVDTADDAAKFAVDATVSGATSFYNTGVAVANWLGADATPADNQAILSGIDDDLGQYYSQNKEAIDLVGFIASSFIPGTAGVKVLNAGQKMLGIAREGWIGTNMARATGLLVPNVEKATIDAATELAQSSAQFSLLNTSTLSAVARGFGQAALESSAFEVAVAATMFKAPTLENQDFGDLVENAAMGTLVGGAIGGIITGAGIRGAIKGTVSEIDQAAVPFTHITELPTGASPADRISQYVSDLDNIPPLVDRDDFVQNYLSKISGIDQNPGAADAMFQKFQSLAETKTNKLNNLIRSNYQELTVGKDPELANFVADSLQGLDSPTIQANLTHLTEIGRLDSKLGTESDIAAAGKKLVTSGAQDAIDSGSAALSQRVGYIKLSGEDAGSVSFTPPKVTAIADTSTDSADVLNTVKGYKFSPKVLWNATDPNVTSTQAEARYIWADRMAPPITDGQVIGQHDIPLLEKAYTQKQSNITLQTPEGNQYSLNNMQDLYNEIKQAKTESAFQLLRKNQANAINGSTEDIAKTVNVTKSYLEGDQSTNETDDLFARQDFKQRYADALQAKGLNPNLADNVDLKPTYLKAGYDYKPITDMNGMVLDGMAHVTAQGKILKQAVDTAVNKSIGYAAPDLVDRFWNPSSELLLKLDRWGAGPRLFSFANGVYHSLASWTETIGQATGALQKALKQGTRDQLESVAYKLSQNPAAAIEFESINRLISSTTEKYVLNDAGNGLIARSIKNYNDAVAAGKTGLDYPKLQEGAPTEIPFKTDEAMQAVISHIRVNGVRVTGNKEVRASQGLEDAKDTATFYPVRPNPKDYNHFAFVTDPTVTGVGHTSMIHAVNAADLEKLIAKVPDTFDVIRKGESEDWHKAIGDYSNDRTLHENYIDSTLRTNGVNSSFFPKTDPIKISQDWLNDHLHRDDVFARTLVSAKFDKEFSEIGRIGEQYGFGTTSSYGSLDKLSGVNKDPYLSYIKTALNINQSSDITLMAGLNNVLDRSFSRAVNAVGDTFAKATSPNDLKAVNDELTRNGIKSAYYDSALNTLANKGPNQGILRDWVAKSNALLSTLTVRINPINALNNAVGSAVLLGPETAGVVRRIAAGDSKNLGPLADIGRIGLPGTSDSIAAPTKIIANAIGNFWKDMNAEGRPLTSKYISSGWIQRSIADEIKMMADNLTIDGSEKVADLNSRMTAAFGAAKSLAQKAETLSGNKLSEQFNRFVAANVMDQITKVGVDTGAISSDEAKGYINTFVNRVHGNLLASQRPLLFQGPIGQAISLFQTYQFNMVQQLLRMVGEGSGKDAAMALGLQGTIYGMQGLPGFNFINQHILGTLSGNPQHRDAYDAVYGAAGKGVADWLMYGLPSNMLKTNIYAHGDMNPRQVTLIPTNPADIPIVKAYGDFFGNLKDTASKILKGGNVWESMLQGIEHAGIIKPLAGLAQTLQATTNDQHLSYSTTNAGNILGTNDLFSLATVSRLAGGTPLDEAILKDATYRYSAYQAYDHSKQQELGQAIKTTAIGGNTATSSQVNQFADNYAAIGGTQKNFNRFMMTQMATANTAQANKIVEHLKHPYAQTMQQIMGGTEQMDGRAIQSNYTGSSNTQ